jgi:hypothetical protein
MKPASKKLLLIVLSAIAFMHVVMIGLGSFSAQLPQWLQPVAIDYTYPLFPQPWQTITSHIPTSDAQLEFRSNAHGSWSEWQDASAAFDYNNNSVAERIEQGINEELRWQILNNLYVEGGRQQFDHIVESSSYSKALYYVLRLHRYYEKPMPDTLQLRMALRFTPEPENAYTFQRTFLEFPKYTLP